MLIYEKLSIVGLVELFGFGKVLEKMGYGKPHVSFYYVQCFIYPMFLKQRCFAILITGGAGMGMAALQQVSTEIREEFKAGEHVVFGAHVDENRPGADNSS